jgi:hypothetical protein
MDQRWPIDPALGDYNRSLFGTNDPHLGVCRQNQINYKFLKLELKNV